MALGDHEPATVARLLRTRLGQGSIDLPVSGSSMRGVIETGSTVEVTDSGPPRRGEVWAFVAAGSDVQVHRIRHLRTEEVVTRGTGNRFDDVPVSYDCLIGRVGRAVGPDGATSVFGSLDRMGAAFGFRVREVLRSARLRLGGARRSP